jgi:Zn-dependent protease with chaperone function
VDKTASTPEIQEHARPVRFQSDRDWLVDSAQRQRTAIIGALIAAWTGLPFALWAAVVGVFFGALVGLIGLSAFGGTLGSLANNGGAGLLGALVGALFGLVAGFLLIYFYLVTHPLQLVGALLSGAIVSAAVLFVMVRAEPWLMRLRGYRVPSRREKAQLDPLLLDAGSRMGLAVVPALWISDAPKPGAWSHMRGIVVTRGLLGDYDASENPPKPDLDNLAISAILAHELRHWDAGDAVALAMVSACFYPFVLIVNAVSWVRKRAEWAGIILWAFLWPVWIASRFVIAPLMASASRRAEYEADASAASLGDDYRLGLRRALDDLSAWERPRTGWEDVLVATHPPIEQRLERLEAPREPEPTRPAPKRRAPARRTVKAARPKREGASRKASGNRGPSAKDKP